MRRFLICLVTVHLIGGCGDDSAPRARPSRLPRASLDLSTVPSAAPTSGGWEVTVYYTAVERYHHGPKMRVRGCAKLDCEHGRADLGRYPNDFLQASRTRAPGVRPAASI